MTGDSTRGELSRLDLNRRGEGPVLPRHDEISPPPRSAAPEAAETAEVKFGIKSAAALNALLESSFNGRALTASEKFALEDIALAAFRSGANTFPATKALTHSPRLKSLFRDKDEGDEFATRFYNAIQADLPSVVKGGEVMTIEEAKKRGKEVLEAEGQVREKLTKGGWTDPIEVESFILIEQSLRRGGKEDKLSKDDRELYGKGLRQIALVEKFSKEAEAATAPSSAERTEVALPEDAANKRLQVIARNIHFDVLDRAFSKILNAGRPHEILTWDERRAALTALQDGDLDGALKHVPADKREAFNAAVSDLEKGIREADQYVQNENDARFVANLDTSRQTGHRFTKETRLGQDQAAVQSVLQEEISRVLLGIPRTNEQLSYALGKACSSNITEERILALVPEIKWYVSGGRTRAVKQRFVEQPAELEKLLVKDLLFSEVARGVLSEAAGRVYAILSDQVEKDSGAEFLVKIRDERNFAATFAQAAFAKRQEGLSPLRLEKWLERKYPDTGKHAIPRALIYALLPRELGGSQSFLRKHGLDERSLLEKIIEETHARYLARAAASAGEREVTRSGPLTPDVPKPIAASPGEAPQEGGEAPPLTEEERAQFADLQTWLNRQA